MYHLYKSSWALPNIGLKIQNLELDSSLILNKGSSCYYSKLGDNNHFFFNWTWELQALEKIPVLNEILKGLMDALISLFID